MKLNLGCGNNKLDGFINIDKFDKEADVMADVCELPYKNDSVDHIVAYQVIEHLPFWKTHIITNNIGVQYEPTFFQECHRVLKQGGTMITECPDFEYMVLKLLHNDGLFDYNMFCNFFGEYYRPWDKDRYDDWEHQAGSLHINAFTWNEICRIAEYIGFDVHRNTMEEKHPAYQYAENLSVLWTKK